MQGWYVGCMVVRVSSLFVSYLHFCKVHGACGCEGDRYTRSSDGQNSNATGGGVLKIGHTFMTDFPTRCPVDTNVLHVTLTKVSTNGLNR